MFSDIVAALLGATEPDEVPEPDTGWPQKHSPDYYADRKPGPYQPPEDEDDWAPTEHQNIPYRGVGAEHGVAAKSEDIVPLPYSPDEMREQDAAAQVDSSVLEESPPPVNVKVVEAPDPPTREVRCATYTFIMNMNDVRLVLGAQRNRLRAVIVAGSNARLAASREAAEANTTAFFGDSFVPTTGDQFEVNTTRELWVKSLSMSVTTLSVYVEYVEEL